MRKNILLGVFALALGACSSLTSDYSPNISAEDIIKHITFLASDSLKGRDTGSEGEALAAKYIIDRFKEARLQPLGDNGTFLQAFNVVRGYKEGSKGSHILTAKKTYDSGKDSILAWAGSASATSEAPLALAGYGIKADNLKYNDLNRSLKGKNVMIMRFGPDGDTNPHTPFGFYWDLDKKVAALIEAGASGVIIADAPLYESSLLDMKYKQGKARKDIPVVQVSAEVANDLVQEYFGYSYESYQKKLNSNKKNHVVVSSKVITVKADVVDDVVIAKNVIGFLKGKDDKGQAIVIGGHYDHLGMGGDNSLSSSKAPQIHNGADDNASGTAGVLELADYFANNRINHSIIFITFSGEELGLLGSDYYANNPTYPIDSMRAMINMDMIGRLSNRNLLIFGTGSSNGWDSLVTKANTDHLEIKTIPDGTGASDHTSFYNKQIPVLHYFTDTHSDYHRPSDDVEFVNASGEQMVLEHLSRVVEMLDTLSTEDFHFTEAPVTQTRSVTMSGPTLGVLPDYGFRGEGLKITGANEGRPGEKAGLKGGDIIIQIGKYKLKDIYDYMETLNHFKYGDKTTIVVVRDGKKQTFNLTF